MHCLIEKVTSYYKYRNSSAFYLDLLVLLVLFLQILFKKSWNNGTVILLIVTFEINFIS